MANTSFGLLVFCFKFLPTADMAAASFDQKAKSCLDCVLGQPRELHALFLDASSHLYMRSCPSVRRSVRRIAGWFFLNAENELFSL